MRFQVPQFIEVEDKIFGPLTFKQFIYLLGGAGLLFVLWAFLPLFLVVLIGVPIGVLALGLTFYKINNRPLVLVMESVFTYITHSRLYLWKKQKKQKISSKNRQDLGEKEALLKVPTLSGSKLKDLAWSLDIKESIYSGKDQQK